MIVYFSSVSGFTHKFVEKLGLDSCRIPLKSEEAKTFTIDQDCVLIIPTYESKTQGYLPRQVEHFLSDPVNRSHVLGVIGTGNLNFGVEYAIAANVVAKRLNVPLLYKLELAGTDKDVSVVKDGLDKFWHHRKSVT
jgi:protein involved in ribonucleotide reduction